MRHRATPLVWMLFAMAGACDDAGSPARELDREQASVETSHVPVYVQYHVWYRAAGCPTDDPGRDFSHWHWWSASDDPCAARSANAPWLRAISSPGYPLIGPYDSLDEDVMRWHIALAQAAGIDGFFVSIFANDPGSWTGFEKMLRLADEAHFEIGVEGWQPGSGEKESWKRDVLAQLRAFAIESPHANAFLRVRGRPAYWFNLNERWMGLAEARDFFDSESATWLLAGGLTVSEMAQLNHELSRSQVTTMVGTRWPRAGGWTLNTRTLADLDERGRAGLIKALHGYPGFDERALPDRERRVGWRNGGATLRGLLADARAARVEMVLIESFNDWNEYTVLEPGFDIGEVLDIGQENIRNGDPYRPLRAIAEFKGRALEDVLPPCAIVDPWLRAAGKSACTSVSILPADPAVLTLQPGQRAELTFNWQGGPTDRPQTVFVHFVDANDTIVFGADHEPSTPSDRWSSFQSYPHGFEIPPHTPSGIYDVLTGLYNPATGERQPLGLLGGATDAGFRRYRIGQVKVAGQISVPEPIVVERLEPESISAAAGDEVSVRFTWQGGPSASQQTVFVHFVDALNPDGDIAFGADHQPPSTTTAWVGMTSYQRIISIPTDLPTGSYEILTGLYDASGRQALTAGTGVTDAGWLRYRIGRLTIR